MANIPDKNMAEFPGFPRGIDNLSEENAVGAGALRQAVNVDLSSEGRPSRRKGYTRVATGHFHSLFSDQDRMYAVVDGVLTAFDEDLNQTPLQTDLGEVEVSYAAIASAVYWTTPAGNGVITPSGAAAPIWPANPPPPALQAAPIGGLAPGLYQVVVTARDAYGRESGAGLAQQIELPAAGGLQLTGFPALPGYVSYCVYMTPTNGDVFYHVRDVPIGVTVVIIGDLPSGRALGARQWWTPMPAGQAIAAVNGRLWVGSGPLLWFSEPMAYGAMAPNSYIRFAADVTLVAPAGEGPESGLFVAAGKRTLYLSGPDPKTMNMTIARPSGAVPGTFMNVHTSAFSDSLPDLPQVTAAMWLSADGVFCLGLPGGRVLPLTNRKVTTHVDAERGAVMVRDDDGDNRFVSALRGGTLNRAAATDQVVGTIYRGGIEVN